MQISFEIREVWTATAGARVTCLIKLSIRFYKRNSESNSDPFFCLDNDSRKMTSSAPFLTTVIQVPPTAKTSLCMQHNAIIKKHFNMFAMADNAFDGRTQLRRRAVHA